MATQTKKLGLMPTLVVLILVLGFALFVGLILLMMLVRTGIEHSPEQSKIEQPSTLLNDRQEIAIPFCRELNIHES
jgi:hypothetical protein